LLFAVGAQSAQTVNIRANGVLSVTSAPIMLPAARLVNMTSWLREDRYAVPHHICARLFVYVTYYLCREGYAVKSGLSEG